MLVFYFDLHADPLAPIFFYAQKLYLTRLSLGGLYFVM